VVGFWPSESIGQLCEKLVYARINKMGVRYKCFFISCMVPVKIGIDKSRGTAIAGMANVNGFVTA
jgi:hypothetical protein